MFGLSVDCLFQRVQIDLGLDVLGSVHLEDGVQRVILGEEAAVVEIEVVIHHASAVVLTLCLSGSCVTGELHVVDGHPLACLGNSPLILEVSAAVVVTVDVDKAFKEGVSTAEPGLGVRS